MSQYDVMCFVIRGACDDEKRKKRKNEPVRPSYGVPSSTIMTQIVGARFLRIVEQSCVSLTMIFCDHTSVLFYYRARTHHPFCAPIM